MAVLATLDLSAPIASLLRSSTSEAHEQASQSKGAGWLTHGELDREEYVRFLIMLYHVYDTFERALEQHAAHPVLQPTYNPLLLARSSSLAADIAHLLQVPESKWQSHPCCLDLMSTPPNELIAYTARLQSLASGGPADVQRLLAHSYVRYLGDLSGGQFIKRQLGKVYGLQDGRGLSFYEFRPLGGGNGIATIGDMKKIKEWYRDGMNAGVGGDVSVKKAILDEADIAFGLNAGLFAILREPTGTITSSSPAPPRLAMLSTPAEDSPSSSQIHQVQKAPHHDARTSSKSMYRVLAVVTLVVALSFSRFFYLPATVLESLQRWSTSTFASSSA